MLLRHQFFLVAISFLLLTTVSAQSGINNGYAYSPSNRPRMVAEWEPAIGVLIAWPLSIPKELVEELAKDTKLYILINDNKARADAVQWLTKWGLTPDRVRFLTAPQGVDVARTRDWGPPAVFTQDGDFKLANAKYLNSTPVTGLHCDDSLHFVYTDQHQQIIQTKIDDVIPNFIAAALDLDVVKLPFTFTGGNVIADGQHSGFSTCALLNENKFTGISEEELRKNLNELLGLDNYHFISNFENKGIQHIDCFMKMLDEDRLFVLRPPKDHPAYDLYEGIVNQELSQLKNAHGRPYKILRLDTDRFNGDDLAAYTNSLILNQTVYVPLFGIHQDSVALKQWAAAMPGYTIKGFPFPLHHGKKLAYYRPQVYELYDSIGWTGGDALHCRTRAIWDPNMIYMSVDRLPDTLAKARNYTINVVIKDYSKGSLVPESLLLDWHIRGDNNWRTIQLTPTAIKDQYAATLAGNMANVIIDYYVEAKSNWGTKAVMPVSAPKGFYSFTIQ
jgi:agmatine deiminase